MLRMVALVLHLGSPTDGAYTKLPTLRAPEWLAMADGYSKLAALKTPEWLLSEGATRHGLPTPARQPPYEKLSALKSY